MQWSGSKPHDARAEGERRFLLRCSCGGLYWNTSGNAIRMQHNGHRCQMATTGSWWERLKLMFGLIQ